MAVLKYAEWRHNILIIFERKWPQITHTHQWLQNQGTLKKNRLIWLNNLFFSCGEPFNSGSKVYKFHCWPHCGLWDACLWHPVHKQMTVAGNKWWECPCDCGGWQWSIIVIIIIIYDNWYYYFLLTQRSVFRNMFLSFLSTPKHLEATIK